MTKTIKEKGTYDVVTKVMRENGFKVKRGVMPEGLELQIREMLNTAYIKGYANGFRNK